MQKYLIDRHIPGAGQLSQEELRKIATRSNEVLASLGPRIAWVQSFVSDDAITCVYMAEDEDLLREHASRGPFPITRISVIAAVIDPSTGAPAAGGRTA